jgi:ParB-like chromosome segregation protein Spo0J
MTSTMTSTINWQGLVQATDGTRELAGARLIPLDQIRPSPRQVRTRPADLDSLIASIRDVGLVEPITVYEIPEPGPQGEKTFALEAGQRRLAAYRALQERFPGDTRFQAIPAIVAPCPPAEGTIRRQFAENEERTGLGATDMATVFLYTRLVVTLACQQKGVTSPACPELWQKAQELGIAEMIEADASAFPLQDLFSPEGQVSRAAPPASLSSQEVDDLAAGRLGRSGRTLRRRLQTLILPAPVRQNTAEEGLSGRQVQALANHAATASSEVLQQAAQAAARHNLSGAQLDAVLQRATANPQINHDLEAVVAGQQRPKQAPYVAIAATLPDGLRQEMVVAMEVAHLTPREARAAVDLVSLQRIPAATTVDMVKRALATPRGKAMAALGEGLEQTLLVFDGAVNITGGERLVLKAQVQRLTQGIGRLNAVLEDGR